MDIPEEVNFNSTDYVITDRELDELEFEIINLISNCLIQNSKNSDSKSWTTYIKNILCGLAKERGLVPYASTEVYPHKEWLWDITWCRETNNNWRKFKEVVLICESEWWSLDEIISDFHKLMVGVAPYRLLITEYFGHTAPPIPDQCVPLISEQSEPLFELCFSYYSGLSAAKGRSKVSHR
jgi:hypothetical protein